MSKILITGGGGYVGSMLTTALINMGHKVTVIDLMKYEKGSLNHLFYNKNFKLLKRDVRDKNLQTLAMELEKKISFVMKTAHLDQYRFMAEQNVMLKRKLNDLKILYVLD